MNNMGSDITHMMMQKERHQELISEADNVRLVRSLRRKVFRLSRHVIGARNKATR